MVQKVYGGQIRFFSKAIQNLLGSKKFNEFFSHRRGEYKEIPEMVTYHSFPKASLTPYHRSPTQQRY